jgi:hypothetical protein
MAEVKKINVGPALTVPLALAQSGGQVAVEQLQKVGVSQKFSALKEHSLVAKITSKADMLWTVLGLVLIFHGAQFKNLFLCTQVVMTFCYGRVKSSILAVQSDVTTALEKMNADEDESKDKADAKAEAKPENKHASKRQANKDSSKPVQQQREEDAAATKKLLKVVDHEKVAGAAFELLVAVMACHMTMQGGLAKVVVVAHALVKASKEKLMALLEFTGHEDMQAWTDLFMTFVLYVVFGGMAIVAGPLAFAMTLAVSGAQLVTENGLRVAESMGKIPGGLSAEAFAASPKGLVVLGGLTAFGTLWQFWALMADNGMAWYFKMFYLPAYMGEGIISLF